ncbi:MAG: hypothetical protein FWG20_02800, partial [Candidatus Cloacimonetes bacterium]|nr:hypothetical protein [Candidatus Cloacimonadota bacterium]
MYKRLLLLTSIFILFSLCYSDGPLTVKNLRVEDNPGDDGSGLVIKFEPLNGHNIIEYRIYRGVTKDSLFFLGKLEVDAKIGISGNEVTFFDKDYRTLVDIDSPRKLQREKGQKEGSPIFKALPRDLTITGPMFQRFSTLVIIDRNRFYRTTEEYIRKTENGRELLGALRLAHTEGVLANVLPGLRYYYTVIAVDERRHYHPHAEIVSGVAVDNKPAKPDKFFALYIEDINQINFEFDSSMSANDIAQYSVFIMYKDQIAQYHKFVEYMDTVDELYMRFPTAEAHAQIYEILPQEVEIPGHQVFASYHTFGSVNIEDGCFAGTDIVFEKEEIDDYLFFLSFDDYGGFQSLSDPIPLKITNSSALPQLPDFVVRDKPADKGDANEILIGKPQAAITQINYRGHGKNRNKLSVAYSYSPLPFYHIKSIDFHFVTTDDKPLKTITRHYFDNVFNVTLPSTINTDDGFKVYISFDASGSDFHQKKLYHQEIYYDKDLLKLKPGPTYLEGEEMLKYRYLILRQSRADTDFSVAAKISPLINISEDIVGEKYVFKGVSGYDIAKKKILFTTDFDMGFDPQAGTMRMSNLFNSYYKDIL